MMEVIVINLDRRKERMERMRRELDSAGITAYRRFPAVDGLRLPKREELVATGFLHKNFLIHDWPARKAGALGNYLSLYTIFKDVATREAGSVTLILEDDVVLPRGLPTLIDGILGKIEEPWDLIYLGMSKHSISKTFSRWRFYAPAVPGHKLYRPWSPDGALFGNFGLLVTPKAASAWLDRCFPITQASDARLGSLVCGRRFSVDRPDGVAQFRPQLCAFAVHPPLIDYQSDYSDTAHDSFLG